MWLVAISAKSRNYSKKAQVPTSGYFKGEVVVRDGKCRDIKTIKKEDEVTLHTQAKLLNGKSLGKTTQR